MWLVIEIQLEALAVEWPKPAEGRSEVDERRHAPAMEVASEQQWKKPDVRRSPAPGAEIRLTCPHIAVREILVDSLKLEICDGRQFPQKPDLHGTASEVWFQDQVVGAGHSVHEISGAELAGLGRYGNTARNTHGQRLRQRACRKQQTGEDRPHRAPDEQYGRHSTRRHCLGAPRPSLETLYATRWGLYS
jgi:hypothetical protein